MGQLVGDQAAPLGPSARRARVQQHPAGPGEAGGERGDLVHAVGGHVALIDQARTERGPRVVDEDADLGREGQREVAAHDRHDLLDRWPVDHRHVQRDVGGSGSRGRGRDLRGSTGGHEQQRDEREAETKS